MDSKQYAPGTVAVATVRGVPNVRVFRNVGGWWSVGTSNPKSETSAFDSYVTNVRPLVVLESDLGGNWTTKGLREGARRCRDAASEFGVANVAVLLHRLADEIEQQPRPPKPPEPTGLGAVVEDRSGVKWVLVPEDGNPARSQWVCSHSTCGNWDAIDVPDEDHILSHGVEDES